MEKFIKGIIKRKEPLSLLEKMGKKETEHEQEITLNTAAISSYHSIGNGKSAVFLINPPFENTNDFWVVCKTDDLPSGID